MIGFLLAARFVVLIVLVAAAALVLWTAIASPSRAPGMGPGARSAD